jgi:hypothetical protein
MLGFTGSRQLVSQVIPRYKESISDGSRVVIEAACLLGDAGLLALI